VAASKLKSDVCLGINGVFQDDSVSQLLAEDTFDDQAEARPEPGHALAFELAKTVNQTAQSSGFRRAQLAQQRDELVRLEEVQDALGCPRQAGQVDGLDQPEQVALRGGAIDVRVARIPFTLDQPVGRGEIAISTAPTAVSRRRCAMLPHGTVRPRNIVLRTTPGWRHGAGPQHSSSGSCGRGVG
jgi:hypothetical protein